MFDHPVKRHHAPSRVRVVESGGVRSVLAQPSVQPPPHRRSYDVKDSDEEDDEGPTMIALSAGQFTALLVMMGVLMFLVLAAAVLAPVLAKYAFPVDVTVDTSNHSRTVTPATGAVFTDDALSAATDTVTAYGQMSNGTRAPFLQDSAGRLLTNHTESVTVSVEASYVLANDTGLAQAASLPERHQTAAQLWAASVEITAGSTTAAVPTYGAASCVVMGGGGVAYTLISVEVSPDAGSTWYGAGTLFVLAPIELTFDDWRRVLFVHTPHVRFSLNETVTFTKPVWLSCVSVSAG